MSKLSIIEFSIENYKIFKEKVTFSMHVPSTKLTRDKSFLSCGENLLKTAFLYGPNASGKTTLLDAMVVFKKALNSATTDLRLPYRPFRLVSEVSPTIKMEVSFCFEKKLFKYGFSFSENGNVVHEYLERLLQTGVVRQLFTREKGKFSLYKSFEGHQDLVSKTRDDVLFLSVASQWNHSLSKRLVEGLSFNLNVISGPESSDYRDFTLSFIENKKDLKEKLLDYLKRADFSIRDIEVRKLDVPKDVRERMGNLDIDLPDKVSTAFLSHPVYNKKLEEVSSYPMFLSNESDGTQKFFNLLGPIIDTLEGGKVLWIDELDHSMHPRLTKYIVDLFTFHNPHNAQLIVTLHDTTLLNHKGLSKYQFWFTEKDQYGSGNLFSLAEFQLRNDREYQDQYLLGRFGAIPYILRD